MITLPQILLNQAADGAATTDVKGAEGKGFGEDFLALLSKALPGKPTPDGSQLLPPEELSGKAMTINDATDVQSGLASLLGNPEKSQVLSSLQTSIGKSADSDKPETVVKDASSEKPLSAAELQTLSALFAMLPQPVVPAKALTTEKTASDTAALTAVSPAENHSATDSLLTVNANAKKAAPAIAADEGKTAATSAAATVAQPHVNDNPQLTANTDSDSREAALPPVNNTAQIAPAASSAGVAIATTTQIAVPTAPTIGAQLGSQEWQQQISQNVTLFTRQGQHSAELRLHPEDLGQVQISLKLEDNQAQLQMISPHSHVRAALEAALPSLRTALAESGIQLSQSDISGESFAQQQSGQQPQQQSPRSAERFSLNDSDAESLSGAESLKRLASHNGAVDIFA